jgi:hypothetical protein
VNSHKDDAAIIAAMRADELLESGDDEGARTSGAIIRRINQLLEHPTGPLN